ncbi:MAG: flagellin [bacterium]|jgi:flagellin|nr:flagellin [bacterium]
MSISRVANNISALNAYRNLDQTGRAVQKSIERLSSGLRINRASDDAAGLSVANRLRTQVMGLDQAVTNASDGINLINVAEGALDETTTRLNRIRTLAIQAANTAVSDGKARQAIQDEVFQNIDEISRIARTTNYGNNYLLNGDFSIKTGTIAGQEDIGLTIDASPVASTLKSGKAYLNIIKTQSGSAQIVAGDALGGPQVLNTGLRNQSDIAISTAYFSTSLGVDGAAAGETDALQGNFFNGVSVSNGDVFVFEGYLSDGVTKYNGSLSLSSTTDFRALISSIQVAIDNTEMALFGLNNANDVPTSFQTNVSLGAGNNVGRIQLSSSGDFINQSSLNITLIRDGEIVTRSKGVTRSGQLGIESAITGSGAVGNAITAITGSTFGAGQFNIEIYDVQTAQQRKVESTIAFRDGSGAILDRTASMVGSGSYNSIVLNGSFVEGNYTGGVSMATGDTITLTGVNADGTTFQGIYTYDRADTAADATLNDFKFNSISGLVKELNYRTRSYDAALVSAGDVKNGAQTRFEDAIFTFTANGSLQLIDDMAQSNSKTNFTLTFQNSGLSSVNKYTFQDDANLIQEGFAEQATFRIDGGNEVRAEAGQVITLTGSQATLEGVAQPEITFRVGSGLSAGIDKLDNRPEQYVGSLNGGAKVTFTGGAQDVVFLDGNSGGNKGVARFVTIDFDSIIDVTARTDGLPDAGRTIILSTVNSSLNFHVGAFADQNFNAAIGDMSAENLGFGRGSGRTVSTIDVTTVEGANDAIRIIDEALDQVNKTRSILGAATNRLESTISNLSVSSENLTASESRIRDADLAKESTEYAKNQVLIQAGVSVLAQANFQGQAFLSLLG